MAYFKFLTWSFATNPKEKKPTEPGYEFRSWIRFGIAALDSD
jgi:hypothetical protein